MCSCSITAYSKTVHVRSAHCSKHALAFAGTICVTLYYSSKQSRLVGCVGAATAHDVIRHHDHRASCHLLVAPIAVRLMAHLLL